jgi:hypothetical protein
MQPALVCDGSSRLTPAALAPVPVTTVETICPALVSGPIRRPTRMARSRAQPIVRTHVEGFSGRMLQSPAGIRNPIAFSSSRLQRRADYRKSGRARSVILRASAATLCSLWLSSLRPLWGGLPEEHGARARERDVAEILLCLEGNRLGIGRVRGIFSAERHLLACA